MAQVGVGGAMHKNSVYYDMSEKNAEGRSARGNTALHPGLRTSMNKYDFNPFLKFGLNLEFNINRTLALGVRAAYNLFLSDMIDGRQFNPNTDGLMDVALNMRFKLMAVSKTHARNVPGRDFPDLRAITTSEAHEYVHKEVAEHVEEAYAAGVEAAKVHDTVIIYHDSVIYRDSIIYRQAATQIAQQQPEDESAAKLAEQKQQPRVYARAARKFYIYFDSDQTELKSEGLISIQQVADLMEEDEELCAVVVGYCDNTGTPESNKELGEKRASVIEEELREEYGIAAGRIYATYGGVVVGRRSSAAYAPNRRVVIELVDKETFKSRQAELGKK